MTTVPMMENGCGYIRALHVARGSSAFTGMPQDHPEHRHLDQKYRFHHELCTNQAVDIARMEKLLSEEDQLNNALKHSVAVGHDLCMNFLISAGASCPVTDLLKIAFTEGQTAIFAMLLDKNCTQEDINALLDFISKTFINSLVNFNIIQLIHDRGFKIEYFDYLKTEPSSRLNDERLTVKYLVRTNELKYLLLNGGAIDHRQVAIPNLTPEQKDYLSLIHQLVSFDRYFRCLFWTRKITSITTYKESLYILHQCGANLWEVNSDGNTPLDIVERNIIRSPRESAFRIYEGGQEFKSYMLELMSAPLSLQSLCRLSLLRHFGDQYLKTVDKLASQLPYPVIDFLRGDDMNVSKADLDQGCYYVGKKTRAYFCTLLNYLHKVPATLRDKIKAECKDVESDDDLDTILMKLQLLHKYGQQVMQVLKV
ncbi:hypothetical protein B566_EDAN017610 [Ephemera danica]|nr:hypothetical protein B566_EDAN017610 [Ephemera danica]